MTNTALVTNGTQPFIYNIYTELWWTCTVHLFRGFDNIFTFYEYKHRTKNKKDILKFQNNLYQDSWALMEELK